MFAHHLESAVIGADSLTLDDISRACWKGFEEGCQADQLGEELFLMSHQDLLAAHRGQLLTPIAGSVPTVSFPARVARAASVVQMALSLRGIVTRRYDR
jgi:hypothetical protein